MANGAVPSDAGSRSAYTRSVAPGFASACLSTRCAQPLCSVDVIRRARPASRLSTPGAPRPDGARSRRPTADSPHLARGSDREPIAGDEERLAAVDARAEVGHQVPERSGLPALVKGLEAFRDAVGRGRDLIRIDRVELFLPAEDFQVPENQRPSAD